MRFTVDARHLVDAAEVTEMLQMSGRRSVEVVRRRYPDFPAPVVEPARPLRLLWLREDVEAWRAEHHVRRGRRRRAGQLASADPPLASVSAARRWSKAEDLIARLTSAVPPTRRMFG
jgi:hypothetical protein